jgi:H+/Cl- antiporter ClcA
VLYLRLVLLGAAIGIPAALVAALFLAAVHEVEHWLWEDLPDALGASSPPWYLVMGLPVVGAVFVIVARAYLPGDGGHSPLSGLGGAPTPLAYAPGIALAGMGTLAFGAVLGPEAPLIALGSAVGLALTHLVTLDPREQHVLGTAGSFSAVSALFGGPLVASMLLLEAGVGLGSAITAALLPGLVAAAVGYLVFIGLGDWGGLDTTALTIPGLPAYDGTSVFDLAVGLVVGVGTALLITAIRRAAAELANPRRWRPSMPLLLLAGAAAVGVLAQLASVLGADSQDVLFSGQESMPALVVEDSSATVLILIVAKGLGYAICLGCGFRGGPVFPALFIGVALAMFAVIAFDVSPTLAVAVGAAAGTAAATRLLFTSLLFGSLLVGTAGVDAVPASVFAASAAWLTMTALSRRTAEPSETKAADQP